MRKVSHSFDIRNGSEDATNNKFDWFSEDK